MKTQTRWLGGQFLRKALLWLVSLLVPVIGAAQGNSGGSGFNNEMALRGRHPEIVRNSLFKPWSEMHRVGAWHEVRVNEDTQMTVAIQGQDDKSVLAALVTAKFAGREGAQIIKIEAIDTSGDSSKFSAMKALDTLKKELVNQQLHAVRPTIDWSGPKAKVGWEIEFISPSRRSTFSVESGKLVGQKSDPVPPGSGGDPPPGSVDDMASNELHHPADFRSEAMLWIGSASTVQDKARKIFEHVETGYRYDSTIVNIKNFTWADTLVRDFNKRAGICDEWAVVSISYLRAVGIPARLKLMAFIDDKGQPDAHAALEYNDGGTWRHMDALWHAFNNPAVYRGAGFTNLTVMDNDFPLDSRSSTPAWGVPEPVGDQKMHPYNDFVVVPAHPGNRRPGYSY